MGQISAYQDAPYQGVSQAPPQVRRRDQAEALEDYLVAIPSGAQKRPPFQFVGVLAGHPGSSAGVFHRVERLAGDMIFTLTKEAAVVVPRVYNLSDLAAQAITVDAASQTYINSGITFPQHDIGCNTVEDFTFTWNRTLAVANTATTAATRPHEGIVWVRGAEYGKTYTVKVAGVTVTLRTPDGTSASDSNWVDTEIIAAALVSGAGYTAVNGASVGGGGLSSLGAPFVVTRVGPVIYITNPSADFDIAVTDGQGGLAMVAAKDKVQKFSDLPQKAIDGFTVRIVQQSGTDQDDFFVKFTKSAGDGTGTWEECIGPGALLGLDKNTMPMGLVNDGGWKFKVLAWKQRATGNEELVKDPDFVGQVIQDVAFWQARLGIVAGEGVTLSCADDPFQLYPRTLSSVLASDPIGRVNPAPGQTVFRYAIPFEHRLVLAGDNIQAELTDDGILTPEKASIDVMTQHEVSPLIRPTSVNGKLYFVSPKGNASGVTEIGVDRITNNPLSEDLTTAAFRYLPTGIDRSAVCSVQYIGVYGVSGTDALYVHLFRHDNQERVQNAFERWHLPAGYTLGGMFFKNTTLYVLACKGGQGVVLKADLSSLSLDADTSATIQTYLDLKASEAQVVSIAYNAGTNQTTITLPYLRPATPALVVRAPGGGGYSEGYVATYNAAASIAAGASKLVVAGDFRTVPFYVGAAYASSWLLSRIYPLDAKGQPLRNGRCNLRHITVDLANTGYIRAEVTAGGRPVQVSEYFGFNWDDPAAHYDTAPNATVVWTFPVMCQNEQVEIKLINDSPFGHSILGLEWTAEFNAKSQRT